MDLSRTKTGLDHQLVDYLNFLWEDGEHLSLAGDTLASVQYFQPSAKRNINQAWRMLKTWQLHELPARATPFTWVTLQMVLGRMHAISPPTALGLLLAFKCLLRTGDLLGLVNKDITISTDKSTILLRLGLTKIAGRNPAAGTVHITDLCLGHLLTTWQHSVSWESPLIPYTSKFRKLFQQVLLDCGLQDLHLKPYSLRRGGTTDMWMSTHSYNAVQHTGRWSSEKVMKQYIDDSTALLSNMKVVPTVYQKMLISHWQDISHVEPPGTWKIRGRGRKRVR